MDFNRYCIKPHISDICKKKQFRFNVTLYKIFKNEIYELDALQYVSRNNGSRNIDCRKDNI